MASSNCKTEQMDNESNEQKQKQERMRTRWTPCLDKIFLDLVVEQMGNRPNCIFDKKRWNHIRGEFNRQTSLNFNNNQLRKHLDVLRTRYYNLKSTFDQQDHVEEYIAFDLWEDTGVQQKLPEMTKSMECPIYDQLCTFFADSGADGKYAQSSHYEELDKSSAIVPLGSESETLCPQLHTTSTAIEENGMSPQNMVKNTAERKRKRATETGFGSGESKLDEKLKDTMSQSLLQMVSSSRLRTDCVTRNNERFSISKCIKALDEIQGIDEQFYFAALDLFEEPRLRERFISHKNEAIRLTWLQGKCGPIFS